MLLSNGIYSGLLVDNKRIKEYRNVWSTYIIQVYSVELFIYHWLEYQFAADINQFLQILTQCYKITHSRYNTVQNKKMLFLLTHCIFHSSRKSHILHFDICILCSASLLIICKFQFLLYVKCHNGPILTIINSTQQNVHVEPSVHFI
jgi:hypothetical protein